MILSAYFYPIHRYPSLICAAATIGGILAACFGFSPLIGLPFCVAITALGFAFSRPMLILAPVFLMASFYRYDKTIEQNLKDNQIPFCCAYATVITQEKIEHGRYFQIITAQTTDVFPTPPPASPVAANKMLTLYVSGYKKVAVGDTIAITHITIKKVKNKEYQLYLIKEGIDASLFVSPRDITVINSPDFSCNKMIATLRNKTMAQAKTTLSSHAFALFSSIFMGNKTASKKQMNNLKEQYKIWGLSHYLARSGLHLVIVVVLWELLLNLVPISFALKQLILIILGVLYYLLSWPSISFIRACGVFLCYKVCTIAKLAAKTLHILGLLIIATLLINPAQLFFLDFQLSFGLTLALAWITSMQQQKDS